MFLQPFVLNMPVSATVRKHRDQKELPGEWEIACRLARNSAGDLWTYCYLHDGLPAGVFVVDCAQRLHVDYAKPGVVLKTTPIEVPPPLPEWLPPEAPKEDPEWLCGLPCHRFVRNGPDGLLHTNWYSSEYGAMVRSFSDDVVGGLSIWEFSEVCLEEPKAELFTRGDWGSH